MRVSIPSFLSLLLLALSSCSLFLSAEERAEKLAIDTAVAYFTFDYQHPEKWMEEVQDQSYYQEFISSQVLPVLSPYMQKYFIKSTAVFVSVEEYARGVNEENIKMIVWKIDVQVNPVWPGREPPSPLDQSPTTIPWTNGEVTTVYAAAASSLGVWNVKLVPAGEVDDLLDTLVGYLEVV